MIVRKPPNVSSTEQEVFLELKASDSQETETLHPCNLFHKRSREELALLTSGLVRTKLSRESFVFSGVHLVIKSPVFE